MALFSERSLGRREDERLNSPLLFAKERSNMHPPPPPSFFQAGEGKHSGQHPFPPFFFTALSLQSQVRMSANPFRTPQKIVSPPLIFGDAETEHSSTSIPSMFFLSGSGRHDV